MAKQKSMMEYMKSRVEPKPTMNSSVYQKLPKETPRKLGGYLEGSGGKGNVNMAAGMNYNVNKNLSVGVNAFGGKDKFGKFGNSEVSATVRIPIGKSKKK